MPHARTHARTNSIVLSQPPECIRDEVRSLKRASEGPGRTSPLPVNIYAASLKDLHRLHLAARPSCFHQTVQQSHMISYQTKKNSLDLQKKTYLALRFIQAFWLLAKVSTFERFLSLFFDIKPSYFTNI